MSDKIRYILLMVSIAVGAILTGCGGGYSSSSSSNGDSSDSGGVTFGIKIAPGIGTSMDGSPMVPMGPSSGGISMGFGY